MELVKGEGNEQPKEAPIQQGTELKRPSFDRSIFFGIQGKESLDTGLKALVQAFPEHHVYILDGQLFGQVTELYIKKYTEWKEQQGVLQFTSKPENIQVAIKNALLIKEAVGTEYFYLKTLVDNSNMTYEQAKSILDYQFAFGFLAKDETESRTKYLNIIDAKERRTYILSIMKGMEKELEQLKGILAQVDQEAGIVQDGQ